ncbi:MAG: hypothetical protein ACHBN1_24795 [Heteroscytonema crispum UTEX LB 1556]
MARPQDRSGSPTFGREVSRGEYSRLQTQAPLHHQPLRASPVLGGKLSRSTRFTTNHQLLT